jgi:hypothetical protein
MTPDEIAAKESELNIRAQELDECEAEIARQVATAIEENFKMKAANKKPPPSQASTLTPSCSTYATSIKKHVPITLGLTASNYTKCCEVFLSSLGLYGLTTHVLAMPPLRLLVHIRLGSR